jgi:hypothetical protein
MECARVDVFLRLTPLFGHLFYIVCFPQIEQPVEGTFAKEDAREWACRFARKSLTIWRGCAAAWEAAISQQADVEQEVRANSQKNASPGSKRLESAGGGGSGPEKISAACALGARDDNVKKSCRPAWFEEAVRALEARTNFYRTNCFRNSRWRNNHFRKNVIHKNISQTPQA